MYIKRYSIAAFIVMGLIGSFFYFNYPNEHFSVTIMGINSATLPIAFWVVLPMVILYLATVSHMIFYSIIGSFKLRKYNKDSEEFADSIKEALLGKIERHHKYKTERYKLFGKVLDNATMQAVNEFPIIGDHDLDEVIQLIAKVERGEHVDLSKYYLSFENRLVIQNNLNAYKAGEISQEQVLNHANKHSKKLINMAFMDYVAHAPLALIEKYKEFMNKEALFKIVSRVNAKKDGLDVSSKFMMKMFKEVELSENDLIRLSVTLAENMMPDERIKLFKLLSEESETAIPAYLYTLFDLEMIAPAEEILENSQADEFIYFKAYKALKDCNQQFSIDLFINQKIEN